MKIAFDVSRVADIGLSAERADWGKFAITFYERNPNRVLTRSGKPDDLLYDPDGDELTLTIDLHMLIDIIRPYFEQEQQRKDRT
jgi:hypothetical protein